MMIYECLMGATRVSIPLKHFNGVPNRENYTSDTDPRPLSVQCRHPHHPPDGCLITWKPLSNISESHGMEGSVYRTLCFHMTLKRQCFWTRRSVDMTRGVTYFPRTN